MKNNYTYLITAVFAGMAIGAFVVAATAMNERDELRIELTQIRRQAVAAGMAEWVMVPGGFKWKENP